MQKLSIYLIIICLAGLSSALLPISVHADSYPKIGNLWGWEANDKDYDKWSHYDMIITSGGPHDLYKKLSDEVKARNPQALIIGSSPFENVEPPSQSSWLKDEWYLRRPDGSKVNWWVGQLYAPNLFIDEYIDGAVDHTDQGFGSLTRDKYNQGFMFDSVVGNVSWYGEVDTNLDGIADKPADVDDKWMQRQNLFFKKLNDRFPDARVIANDVDLRHAPYVNGRLFEGGKLLDRIPAGYSTVQEAVHILKEWTSNSRQPSMTMAIMSHPVGWQWWRLEKTGKSDAMTTPGEIELVKRDFPRMRLGLLTTLMTDAYYCYDFGTTWYGYPLLYPEFDAPLGKPLGESKEVFFKEPKIVVDWQAGKSTDLFKLTPMSRVRGSGIECSTKLDKAVFNMMLSTNPAKVRLKAGGSYRIIADFDILKKSDNYFQFVVRTPTGGFTSDRSPRYSDQAAGEPWHVETTIKLDSFPDYSLQVHQLGSGSVRLTRLKVMEVGSSYFIRRFEGGVALLNPTTHPIEVKLDKLMKRLKNDDSPRHVIEIDDIDADKKPSPDYELTLQKYRNTGALAYRTGFRTSAGWETQQVNGHHYGDTYRVAGKPGETAEWRFTAPSDDEFTIYGWMVGGKEFTDSASYTINGAGILQKAAINQRDCNGEWTKLFSVKLKKNRKYRITLTGADGTVTAADAVRIESRSRYNDGTAVRKVRLNPLDGVILLNR
ncbi:MAG: golvesin C-terminal-like domain-containing protein [Armatimonadota bacterium]